MAITYRIGNDAKLSVEEMDGNFSYIEEQIAGLTASVTALQGGPTYKKYVALISQSGTASPVEDVVFENTLSNPVTFYRGQEGVYRMECLDFIVDKTIVSAVPTGQYNGTIIVNFQSDSNIYFYTTPTGPSQGDGIISNTPIEIKVYN